MRQRENRKFSVISRIRFHKAHGNRAKSKRLDKKQYLSAYVDLWPTDDEVSFATATAKAITESMSTNVEGLFDTARTFFGRLVPIITVNDEGKPQVTFGISRTDDAGPGIDEALAAPAKIAAQLSIDEHKAQTKENTNLTFGSIVPLLDGTFG